MSDRDIWFSDLQWHVKTGYGGPGPNWWCDDPDHVYVDGEGLHLWIKEVGGRWCCSEVYSHNSFGYRDYIFYLNSRVDQLDPCTVVGLFTYLDDENEIDIEFSKWCVPDDPAGQYVVQPYWRAGNIERFDVALEEDYSAHHFDWVEEYAFFQSWHGHYPYYSSLPNESYLIHEWVYTGADIPTPANEKLHLNFWLFQGRAPLDSQPAEVVVGGVEVRGHTAAIHGREWCDSNGNGLWDDGEPPLANARIYLDRNGNDQWDSNELYKTTDADGAYWFIGLQPDITYKVAEVVQPGWWQTAPLGGTYEVRPNPGQVVEDVNFGNRLDAIASLGPVAFLELHDQDPSAGDLCYEVETTQQGYLTVEAAYEGLPESVELALYDQPCDGPPLALSNQRIDWQAGAPDETYYLKLSGTNDHVDLRLANLVCKDGSTVTVYDHDGNDTFRAHPGSPFTIVVNDVQYAFDGVALIQAYGSGDGLDMAQLLDSADNDTFLAYPDWAELRGDAFAVRVDGYEAVHAYATADGFDKAMLFDSPENDLFEANPIEGMLYDEAVSFYSRAKYFEQVHAYSTAGGNDAAELSGSDENDVFYADSIEAYLHNGGSDFFNRAKYFQNVHADLGGGDNDQAEMRGSSDDNEFDASPGNARFFGDRPEFYGNNFDNEVWGVEQVEAYATAGGSNKAHLYGSEGIEHLEAKDEPESDWVRMSNQIDGWSSRAVDFDTVHAHASAGKDTADIDPEMLDSQLVLDLVCWDGQGDGNWSDFADGHSRWLSAQDDPLTFCPDSQFINVAVRTNTVTVASDCSACSLRVEGGSVLVEADNTLAATENVSVVAGAKYVCELDAAGNGLIAAAGDVFLYDETTLELLVLESLGDPGCYTRTILSSAGEQGIDGDFQTKPAEGDYLDYGAFLRGYDISLVEYKLDLFQAGPGDFDGDGDVDLDDLSLLDDGWDPTATDKIWTEGDGDGDGDVDLDDLSILDDAWAPAGYPVVNCGEEGAAAGQVEGSDERSGHDAAVQEVFEQASDSRETSPGKWAWLYEFEQISTQSRPPQKHNQAAEAVDKLLASYWP